MARTPKKLSAELAGPPRAVARHVEVPLRIFDQDVTITWVIEASKAERFAHAFARETAIAKERSSQGSPDINFGDGS